MLIFPIGSSCQISSVLMSHWNHRGTGLSHCLLMDWRINKVWQMCKDGVRQTWSKTTVSALRTCLIYLGRASQHTVRISYGVGYTWNKKSVRRDQCGLQLTKKIFIKKIRLRWLEKVQALGRDNEIGGSRWEKTQNYVSRNWCVEWGRHLKNVYYLLVVGGMGVIKPPRKAPREVWT